MARFGRLRYVVGFGAALLLIGAARKGAPARTTEDVMIATAPVGRPGGNLTIAIRSDPKTLNPALAADAASRDIIYCMNADLIRINRETQKTEPGLAKSWNVSRDGRTYTLELRRGVEFSDGHPFTADDVVFSFQVYLDQKLHSPQRDLLIVGGKPVAVQKLGDYSVRFQSAEPYAAAERLFDGLPVLPKHLLESAYRNGDMAHAWSISSLPSDIAGLGPFRLKQYVPGEKLVLQKNPHYWKVDEKGNRLPYLDQLTFLFVPSEDAQVIRFQAGDTDVLSRFSAQDFAALERDPRSEDRVLSDIGPGLEYNFLFFNLNELAAKSVPQIARKQVWFRDARFRQAVSAAIDRQAIVRLVYAGRATPLWSQVTPGNKMWADSSLPHPARSLTAARDLLKAAGFSWNADGNLIDPHGAPVEFSILASSSNGERLKIATLIQSDLSEMGMNVHVVSLDFGAMVDRLLNSFNYEAAVMGLASGDVDPTAEMNVWASTGGTHLWHLNEARPATPWEAEMDRLMNRQLITMDYRRRKALYDRVQQIVSEELPVICLASPDVLVAAKKRVGNFHPAILDPYALWNVEDLYLR